MFKKRPILLLTPDVDKLKERLRKLAIGELVTYAELSKLVARDVKDKDRYVMATALRHLEKSERLVFLCVTNEGWRRVGDEDKIHSGEHMRKGIRRKAKRMATRVQALDDYSKLSAALQQTQAGLNAVAAIIGNITGKSGTGKLQLLSPAAQRQPDVKKLLAAFAAKPVRQEAQAK